MKHLTEDPVESLTPHLSRRALLSALVALTATPTLSSEVLASPHVALKHDHDSAVDPLPRRMHTAVALHNGLILVTGGVYGGTLADTQLFHPASGRWYPAAPMNTPRAQHAAVALGGGRVLVLGGFYQGALADAEIYSHATDSWTPATPMEIPRYDHTAVLLGDGSVLIYGGAYQDVLDSPELYTLSHNDRD
ncbi:MAG: uncharacterized protein JWN14_4449 [Chthonomonadales bacterium]|nr:uncharacterized protein [Chthonomonadales bacterium]